MKRPTLIISILLLLLSLACAGALAEDTADGHMDEWTVMFYFCGSDLESKHAYATGNLQEISEIRYPDSYLDAMMRYYGLEPHETTEMGKVNILIETGGSSQWHAQELGMDISTEALQRWRYNVVPWGGQDTDGPYDGYELLETLPLQSMADPETLTDFIRWGRETCPAKKYALVLWGHGDGARSGLFIDELFDGDIMCLYELKQALADAQTHLEAVIIDACLMANIETAWAVKDSASWMVASEEVVPGNGTAIDQWMQQLLDNPWGDGKWLGRCVCDTTAMKYANLPSEEAKNTLTWSVIDLSKVDALVEGVGEYFIQISDALKSYPLVANLYMSLPVRLPEFGDGSQNMKDFGSLIYNSELVFYSDTAVRGALIQALTDAVDYCVRGSGRSDTRGLSFCYPLDFDDEQMNIYAKNCPMPRYLAFIDGVSSWTAPDWVYEYVERTPEIDSIDELRLLVKKKRGADGMPGVVYGDSVRNMLQTWYRLYRLDDETGELLWLGSTDCFAEALEDEDCSVMYRAADPMHWPAIDGNPICMELIQTDYYSKLYNVPVMINGRTCILRCGRFANYAEDPAERINEYEIYGLWEGYDAYSTLYNRSVTPLAMFVGQEYQLMYPIDDAGAGKGTYYKYGEPQTMYRSLMVEEVPLPAGTYYLEYEVTDMYMRKAVLDRIEIQWDGETMTFPQGDAWENDEWINMADLRK